MKKLRLQRACHELGIKLLSRGAHTNHEELSDRLTAQAMRLLGAYQRGLEVLDRHRAQGKSRTVRIEHVHVNAGGQVAIGIPSASPRE